MGFDYRGAAHPEGEEDEQSDGLVRLCALAQSMNSR